MKSPHPQLPQSPRSRLCSRLTCPLGCRLPVVCLCAQDKSRNALLRAAFNETSEKWEVRLDGMSGAQARRRLWEMTEQQRLVGGPCRRASLLSACAAHAQSPFKQCRRSLLCGQQAETWGQPSAYSTHGEFVVLEEDSPLNPSFGPTGGRRARGSRPVPVLRGWHTVRVRVWP